MRVRARLQLVAVAVVLAGFAVVLTRDRGVVGRVVAFEVEGSPYVAIIGERYDQDSGEERQKSVITWDLSSARKACQVGFSLKRFAPVGAMGRHLWVDRHFGSVGSEIALWDLASCEERFGADDFQRAAGKARIDFGVGRRRPVDPVSGQVTLARGFALNVDGTVRTPPDDSFARMPSRPSQSTPCRFNNDLPACSGPRVCVGVPGGQLRVAASADAPDPTGPVFLNPVPLGAPGLDGACVHVREGSAGPEVLIRHAGSKDAQLPPGLALVGADGGVRWNVPGGKLPLFERVVAVVGSGGDVPLTIVSAEEGSFWTGGYSLRVVRLDAGTGAVRASAQLP